MSFSVFSDSGRSKIADEYVEESLFCLLANELQIIASPRLGYTKYEMWYEAKNFVKDLCTSKRPDLKLTECLISLFKSHDSKSSWEIDGVGLGPFWTDNITPKEANRIIFSCIYCIYAILYYTCVLDRNNAKLEKVLNSLLDTYGKYVSINTLNKTIDDAIESGEVVYDYDYINNKKLDIDEVPNDNDNPEYNNSLHDKVRLELACKLIECSKVNLETRGIKTKVAKLLHVLTGISVNVCANYLTNRDVSRNFHSKEIEEVNDILKKAKSSVTI